MSWAEHPLRAPNGVALEADTAPATVSVMRRGSGPVTLEVASEPRLALAVRLLFTGGFDTLEIAALLQRSEAEIVDQLYAGRLADGGR